MIFVCGFVFPEKTPNARQNLCSQTRRMALGLLYITDFLYKHLTQRLSSNKPFRAAAKTARF